MIEVAGVGRMYWKPIRVGLGLRKIVTWMALRRGLSLTNGSFYGVKMLSLLKCCRLHQPMPIIDWRDLGLSALHENRLFVANAQDIRQSPDNYSHTSARLNTPD